MTEAKSRSCRREGANEDFRIEDLCEVEFVAAATLAVEVGCDLAMLQTNNVLPEVMDVEERL
jgi:hypothetical protein